MTQRALTAKGTLQNCKSTFESGQNEYRMQIEEISIPANVFDVSFGFTSSPFVGEIKGDCEDDYLDYIEMKDWLEEDVMNQATLFFSFPVEVYTDGEEIVIKISE